MGSGINMDGIMDDEWVNHVFLLFSKLPLGRISTEPRRMPSSLDMAPRCWVCNWLCRATWGEKPRLWLGYNKWLTWKITIYFFQDLYTWEIIFNVSNIYLGTIYSTIDQAFETLQSGISSSRFQLHPAVSSCRWVTCASRSCSSWVFMEISNFSKSFIMWLSTTPGMRESLKSAAEMRAISWVQLSSET